MTFTHAQFIQLGVSLVFLAIAGATWLASLNSKIIDFIAGVIVFLIICAVLLTIAAPMLHF